ncbi:basigin-like, partial [Anneissia japonica]|uniref:basigin-like n=1 Tax=Anneissia japonica TaxID=1529436 RepID=UPI0014258EAA
TGIFPSVSQCLIEGKERYPEGDDPQLVCTCTESASTETIWWCFHASCEKSQGLGNGADYNIQSDFDGSSGNSKSTLTIISIQEDDVGVYFCRSSNGDGFEHKIENVFADVKITLDPEGDAELKYGEDIVLTCTIDQPDKQPIWMKGDATLNSGDNHVSEGDEVVNVNGGKLTIKDANIQQAGTYMCSALNSESPKSVVLWTRIDITADHSVKVTEGKNAELVCEARSSPMPNIFWKRDGQKFNYSATDGTKDPNDDIFTRTSTLKIEDVTTRRTYTCEATHEYTNATSHDILLRVRGKLAWLWPFLVVIGISVILAAIYIVLHFKEGHDEGDEEEDEDDMTMLAGKTKKSADAAEA